MTGSPALYGSYNIPHGHISHVSCNVAIMEVLMYILPVGCPELVLYKCHRDTIELCIGNNKKWQHSEMPFPIS